MSNSFGRLICLAIRRFTTGIADNSGGICTRSGLNQQKGGANAPPFSPHYAHAHPADRFAARQKVKLIENR